MPELNFIDTNPATEAYRRGIQEADRHLAAEVALEGAVEQNRFNAAANPSRLRSLNAGARTSEAGATLAERALPSDIDARMSAARTARTHAELGERTLPADVDARISAARTARTTAELGERALPADLAAREAASREAVTRAGVAEKTALPMATATLRGAEAGATERESDARVKTATEADRVRTSGANLRTTEAHAVDAEMAKFYKVLELAQTNPAAAREAAKRYGENIPEGVLENQQILSFMTAAANRAKELYPNRPRDQQEFIHAWLTQIAKAKEEGKPAPAKGEEYFTPEGAPTPPEFSSPNHKYTVFNREELGPDGKMHFKAYGFDTSTGQWFPISGEGAMLKPTGAGGPGAGGRDSVFQQKQKAWLAVHPGDEAGALDYANNKRSMSSADNYKAAFVQARQEAALDRMLGYDPKKRDAFIKNRAQQIFEELEKYSGRGMPATPGPTAPAPTAPTPTRPTVTVYPPASAAPRADDPFGLR